MTIVFSFAQFRIINSIFYEERDSVIQKKEKEKRNRAEQEIPLPLRLTALRNEQSTYARQLLRGESFDL